VIDFDLAPEVAELEAELERFARNDLRTKARDFETAGSWDEPALKTLDSFAVPGLDLPEQWGGAGVGVLAKVVALETVAFGDAGGLISADPIGVSASALVVCPDKEAAKEVASSCLLREGESALIFGERVHVDWVQGASAPAWTWISEGRKLQLFETRGCSSSPALAGAFHASGGITFDLSGGRLLGEWALENGEAHNLRGRARLWAGSLALGIARASLEYAIEYSKDRIVMGKAVAHHQGNAFAIAEAAANIEAARASMRAAAHRTDEGAPNSGLWATLAYLDATDAALAVTDLGVMLLGGHGYIEDHPAEKWFREARMLAQLFGGRDAALEDAEAEVLEAPDPLVP
jgi:alkylation response protein AidB-like acyl-CoA dehydrogenase